MMMCSICSLPVLELDGQFENLQPYYAEAGHPAASIVGECHSSCVVGSEHGRTWYEWRVRSYSSGHAYRVVAEQDAWTILAHLRYPELLAFNTDGTSVAAKRGAKPSSERPVEGGLLLPVEEVFNLRHDDVGLINDISSHLVADKTYPVAKVLEALAIADRVKWPQALTGAMFLFDRKTQRQWTRTGVAMRASYHKMLPDAVVPAWRRL